MQEVTSYNRDSGDWRSVIAWGDAVVVSEDLRSAEAVSLLLTKYRRVMGSPLGTSRGMPMAEEVVVAVRLEHISGRSSGSFLAPKTRPGRL